METSQNQSHPPRTVRVGYTEKRIIRVRSFVNSQTGIEHPPRPEASCRGSLGDPSQLSRKIMTKPRE